MSEAANGQRLTIWEQRIIVETFEYSPVAPGPAMLHLRSLLFLTVLATAGFCGMPSAHAKTKANTPNVVVIFIDDMGYADIGPFSKTDMGYETPHLDQMAKEGRIFTDFYVTQAVCSASRSGLLTGCYNVRVGILGALGPKANHGINADEMTLAEVCKQKDYATACYGKWHLGHHRKFLPMQHGFDDYYGLPYSNDMWPYHPAVLKLPMEERLKRWPHLPLIEKNEIIDAEVTGEEQENLTTDYTQRAVKFIEDHKDEPFFVYLPHSMVHVPLYVSDKFKGKSKRGLFGDVMMEVDWSVGQVLDTLKKYDLDENTLVIFTADNGPWLNYGDHAGSASPLREGKGTMFDGGCRESTVMWWPGTIPAGTVCRTPAMTIDILPTVAELIGAKLPDHTIDGKNILPLMTGESDKSPQEAYYFYYGSQLQAVRQGKWKLHFPHGYRSLSGRQGGTDGIPVKYDSKQIGLALFDLDADIGESTDVKGDHPDVVARLQKLGDKMRAELGDSKKKGKGNRPPGRLEPGEQFVGTWHFTIELDDGTELAPSMTVTRDGTTLKGEYHSTGDRRQFDAKNITVKNNQLEFTIEGESGDNSFKVTYHTLLNGHLLVGTIDYEFNGNTGELNVIGTTVKPAP
jgi:arylsulfatase A